MPATGEMRDRYTFQRRTVSDQASGDRQGAWGVAAPDALTVAAKTVYLHGTEAVQAQRLQGVQPVVLTIRVSSAAKQIDNAWRAVDARDASRVFNVTSVEPTPDRAFLQVLAVTDKGQSDG